MGGSDMRDFNKRWGQGTVDRGGDGSDVAVGNRPLVIDPTTDRRGTGPEVGPGKMSLVDLSGLTTASVSRVRETVQTKIGGDPPWTPIKRGDEQFPGQAYGREHFGWGMQRKATGDVSGVTAHDGPAPTPDDVARDPNRSQQEVRQPTADEPTKAPPPHAVPGLQLKASPPGAASMWSPETGSWSENGASVRHKATSEVAPDGAAAGATLSGVNLEGARVRGARGLDNAIVNDIYVGPAPSDHLIGAAARDWLLLNI